MDSLDWTLLRAFLAVIETGSLSAAAQRIGATQPTLSRHIRELETQLGVTLFRRSAQGLEPTESGLALIEDAQAMGRAADALLLKASGRTESLRGTVRITASVVMSNLILPPIIAALRRDEPLIEIEIVASDQSQNLLRRDADIAIRMFDPTQGALIARKLGETPLGLYGARDYLERRGRPQSVDELPDFDLIGFDRDDTIIRNFQARGMAVSRHSFGVRSDDQVLGWHLLRAGAGLGFAQVKLADGAPELERLLPDLPLPSLPVWLVMHEEVRANARIRRVADALSEGLLAFLSA
jgi:DNA-binding transcriptional LysR family regulator